MEEDARMTRGKREMRTDEGVRMSRERGGSRGKVEQKGGDKIILMRMMKRE